MLQSAPEPHNSHGGLEVTADSSTYAITVPDAHLLFAGEFKRAGTDLILSDHDHKFVVHDYFRGDHRPTLLSPEGGRVTGDVVEALTGHGDYAQAGPAQNTAAAVGRIVKVDGDATIIRNGVAVTLHVGDAILKDDVLQTGGGTMSVTFNDGSTLDLNQNARLVVNEFIYNPHSALNSELLNLVQGSLTFVAGEVAHTGKMDITTPVATMGIRGTVGTIADGNDGYVHFSIIESPTGAVILDSQGHVIATIVAGAIGFSVHFESSQVIAQEEQKSQQQINNEQALLQQILSNQAIGEQILQQFSQNQNNPQSIEHHTQIQLDIPLNALHALDSGNPITQPVNVVVTTTITTTTIFGTITTTTTTQDLQFQNETPVVPTQTTTLFWAGDVNHTGTWGTGANWNPGQAPTLANDVVIGQDQSNQPVSNANVTSSDPLQANSIILHNGAQLHASEITTAGDIAVFGDLNAPTATEITGSSCDLTIDSIGGELFVQATTEGAAILADGNLSIGPVVGSFTVDGSANPCATDFAEISADYGNLTIGNIGTNFFNQGLIHADYGTLTIGTIGGTFVNYGVLRAHQILIAANAGEVLDNHDSLLVAGCGPASWVYVELHNSGLVKATYDATLDFSEHVHNSGLIEAKHGGTIAFFDSVHNTDCGTILAVGCGSEIDFNCGSVDNGGTIAASWGGYIDFNHWVGGNGALAIDGGTIELASGTCNDIQFGSGCGGALVLDNPLAHIGQISGFGFGESIDLSGLHDVSIADYTPDQSGGGGVLHLESCEGNICLAFTGDYAFGNFALSQNGCGTQITDQGPVLTLDNPQVTQVTTDFCGDTQDSTQVNDLQIFDPFAGNHLLNITASAGEGRLSLLDETFNNVTYTDFHHTFSACGTLCDLNAALQQGVLYTPEETVASGTAQVNDMVTVKVTDQCNGATDTINLVFNAANPNDQPISLTGTSGKDFIYASGYNDTLTGGASADTFVFAPHQGSSQDVITDFNVHQDFLNFDHTIFDCIAEVLNSATDDGHGNTIIADAHSNSITLDNVTKADLAANQSHILIAA